MSVEEKAEILAPFKARAEKGELIDVGEIEEAYQSKEIIVSGTARYILFCTVRAGAM